MGGLVFGAFLIVSDFFLLAWFFARGSWGAFGFGVALALGVFFLARSVAEWRGTRCILTNQRVLMVRQIGLWSRSVAEAPLERVQDVRIAASGVRATLFRYGTLTLELVGGATPLQLPGVPKPESVQELIGRLQEEQKLAAKSEAPPVRPGGRVDAVRRV
jgi:uncharacterized membrane protein YdbT with pleckstrin-like domain